MLPPALSAAVTRVCEGQAGGGVEFLAPLPLPFPGQPRLHIAILDSSFNPPTRAHLAMASTAFPPLFPEPSPSPGPYTARLLLYSPRNADKTPKPRDATPHQRAEMMLAAARATQRTTADPVGVALLSEPTFVAKAQALSTATGLTTTSGAPPELTFVVGTDTLVRIFQEKYYTATPGGLPGALGALFARARLVCVSRGDGEEAREAEETLAQEPAAAWVKAGRVRVVDAPAECEGVSSTAVRRAAAAEDVVTLKALCCDEVGEFVLEQGLYRE